MYFESNTLRTAGLPRGVSSSMRAVSKSKPELEGKIWLSKDWAFHLEGNACGKAETEEVHLDGAGSRKHYFLNACFHPSPVK